MARSIRDRQKRLTEETVIVALAECVTESGSLDFSIAEIAERAGVSARTIYNHFGDRQGLIEALAAHAGREMERHGATNLPATSANCRHSSRSTTDRSKRYQSSQRPSLASMTQPSLAPAGRAEPLPFSTSCVLPIRSWMSVRARPSP